MTCSHLRAGDSKLEQLQVAHSRDPFTLNLPPRAIRLSRSRWKPRDAGLGLTPESLADFVAGTNCRTRVSIDRIRRNFQLPTTCRPDRERTIRPSWTLEFVGSDGTRRDTAARKSRLFRPFDVVSRSRCPYLSPPTTASGSGTFRARGDNCAELYVASYDDFPGCISLRLVCAKLLLTSLSYTCDDLNFNDKFSDPCRTGFLVETERTHTHTIRSSVHVASYDTIH